jgi:hypothetical protein
MLFGAYPTSAVPFLGLLLFIFKPDISLYSLAQMPKNGGFKVTLNNSSPKIYHRPIVTLLLCHLWTLVELMFTASYNNLLCSQFHGVAFWIGARKFCSQPGSHMKLWFISVSAETDWSRGKDGSSLLFMVPHSRPRWTYC